MAVNCFICCFTSRHRAGSVRRSASRNLGVRVSVASVQNFDESASRSTSPPRAAASTSLRAALASGVVFVRLTRRAGGVIGDAIGRGLQPRRGGGEVGGLGLHRRRGGGVIGGIGGFSVRVGKRIGGSALRTRVGGCCMGIFVLSGLTRRSRDGVRVWAAGDGVWGSLMRQFCALELLSLLRSFVSAARASAKMT